MPRRDRFTQHPFDKTSQLICRSFHRTSRSTSDSPGVTVKVPKWGSTDGMEWVDETYIVDHYDFGAYFDHIVEALVDKGYERSTNIFGAPYDFRRGPSKAPLLTQIAHEITFFIF